MHAEIDSFIRYLATERGLSDNYQISVRRSLEGFSAWLRLTHGIHTPDGITLPLITDFLGTRKRARLAAGSIKLELVAIKIFLRYLHVSRPLGHADVGETLTLPRIERNTSPKPSTNSRSNAMPRRVCPTNPGHPLHLHATARCSNCSMPAACASRN